MRQAVTTEDPTHFEIEEYEDPPLAATEVLLRVRATGICGSDLHAYRGGRWRAGRVLGHEIAGEVASVGSEVTGLELGERVALQPRTFCGRCAECRGGRTELCVMDAGVYGLQMPGGFRETLVVPQQNLFPVEPSLDFAVAALAEPLAVAVHGHRVAAQLDAARPTNGERVVVLGGGPIGLMCVFYAAQAGASEIAVTARYEQQAEAAKRLGATHVFEATSEGEAALEDWSRGHPVDLVMETVGGVAQTPTQAARVVRRGGRILILGGFSEEVPLSANLVMGKQLRVAGTIFYGYIGMQHDYEIATALVDAHRDVLATLITHRVPLEEAARGIEYAGNKSSGAVKVTVEP
jgi:L-iditol 2-dehydrogenase